MEWNTPLTHESTKEDCKAWLEALYKSNKQFHIDDDPHDIITGDGTRTFTDEEADLMDSNLERCCAFYDWNQVWDIYHPMED